ncbi:hypothetical protein BSFA1_82050 (plasmid) [Burkholderia sp. SFA1]|uniref:Lipoprotein n=1 Tax=Burkholderia vietnamiensis (strain G4 / LMG 22486) TaxID=269482 RepID=A4JTM3_BURVG|nr:MULTISPECIES: hypothetical protein [Caballeronia]ABO59626.1 hypothetical protein Bcep1808_6738 [Burkholderia vietnamiensis G4]AET95506.1 hypothetical protein BYI23_E003450 [Burkholderia sp. YI23]MCB4350214.1 hypothetical protein [Burkholderia vietnamiensis]BBQ03077.1 hypothetical protein BSFA1_82050 [Burkholderia sp. SFA1]MDR5799250.1 hypothetical protein [Caballeronia sp. LZ001]
MYSSHARRFARGLIGLTVLISCGQAVAAEPKDILFAAIRNGSASETLSGAFLEGWQSRTHSTSPILMTAEVVKRYQQQDCARLRVTMRQENIPKKDGSTGPLQFSYELNLCTDGMPPAEAVDWSKVPPEKSAASPEQIK